MRFSHWLGGALLAVGTLLAARPVAAATPGVQLPVFNTFFHGAKYSTCTIDPARDDLRLYWADAAGNVLGNFTALQKQLTSEGSGLEFAANAGTFDTTSKPVGLLVLNGEEKFPLNLQDGCGNFYLKPNGVFVINQHHHALVVKSGDYPALAPPALWATQSGPLLVEGGDVNPDFMPDSKNRKIRSGVGVNARGEAVFALSRLPVTFYEFAELFRAKLHCPNALYLDGDISDFWTPGTPEKENQHHFGPMIGVVESGSHEGVTAAPAGP
jgi:uncharacterized protein YigE (DUF2233 family)